MNENIYNIHWERFRHMLVPGRIRKPKLLALLKALLAPHVLEYERFRAFASSAVYRVSHNGSIVSLTEMLNDKFNAENWRELPPDHRIYIRNIQQKDAVRFYPNAAEKQVGFYPVSAGRQVGFYPSMEYDPSAADFTVHVPLALQPAAPELLEGFLIKMPGQLDYYKLYAKKYRIVFY